MSATTDHTHHEHRQPVPDLIPDGEAAGSPERTAPPEKTATSEKTGTPEAVRAATVAGRTHSGKLTTGLEARRARGVEWVRPTDLLARQGTSIACKGIDFEVELARRSRQLTSQAARASGRGISTATRAVSERARRLPDVSEFGRGSRSPSWATRSGIGLG